MADSKEPSLIKEIVDKVIASLSGEGPAGKQRRLTEEDIQGLWEKAAGKLAGRRSNPVSLKKGKLVVSVADSSLLYDLTLRKREILENLRKELKDKVQEIQFRIGETRGDEKTKGKTQKRG